MGKQAKLKAARREEKKKAPHVVLLAGSHFPGAEVAVEAVIAAEKPAVLAIEAMQRRSEIPQILETLKKNAEAHAKSENDHIAYQARMYLLARKHGISFDYIEKLSDAGLDRSEKLYFASIENINKSIQCATRGEVETRLSSTKLL